MDDLKVEWSRIRKESKRQDVLKWHHLADLVGMDSGDVIELAKAVGEYDEMDNKLRIRRKLAKKFEVAGNYDRLSVRLGRDPTLGQLRSIDIRLHDQIRDTFDSSEEELTEYVALVRKKEPVPCSA